MRRLSTRPSRPMLALVGAAAAFAATSTASAQSYTVTDLGTLGGPVSGAFAVNDFGRVAGASTGADANMHAFIWEGGLTDVGPLSGDQQSHGFGLTNSGRLLAASYDLGEVTVHGFVWEDHVVTPLGDFLPRDGNGSGIVVGYVSVNDPSYGWLEHAARWVHGDLIDMGTLGGHFSYAYAIASDGRIVGMSFTAEDAARRAFLWMNGVFHDLGTLGGTNSQAYAINDSGDVVGWAETGAGQPHAFLFTTDGAGQVTSRRDLGELAGGYSYAYAVNNQGQVVGVSGSRAFLWAQGVMTDLNTLISPGAGWRLESAWDVNDSGQIVGLGQHHGLPHAFLLTPQICPDLDGDGAVGFSDLVALLANYGTPGGATFEDGDLDGDGDVDFQDLVAFLSYYGMSCG